MDIVSASQRLRLTDHVTNLSPERIMVWGEPGPFILYCTNQTNPGFHHHRMSADCYFGVTSHSMIFTNHVWLFRKKNKEPLWSCCTKLQWPKKSQQVFMNGKLAFGRCNTYFNVSCCFSCLCIVQCHGYWSVWSMERDKNSFFFKPCVSLSLFCWTGETVKHTRDKDRTNRTDRKSWLFVYPWQTHR